ncbi:glucan endo-1,3-beta-glucosidase, acidic-like [Prosopis cineraria]|uniref:glucan endo-1,3-beta-glucosidase, acidic-like n=1 Tax=Prosopis cineraria TaxID=364024 RepID=UPI0024100FFD|nr:glucan endo-1,3-beta-glucosidase, acidic-like [Prosopis cineraria]
MSSIMLLLVMLLSIALQLTAVNSIGVCYGVYGNNLPRRREVIDLYKSNGIGRMRIYYPDEYALQALRGSNIEVLLDVAKETLPSLTNPANANAWVRKFVASYPDVNIKYIAVGNEIGPHDNEASYILPGMQNIQKAISAANLQGKVKVSTAIKMDRLEDTSPPNKGKFKDTEYIQPIINFLVTNRAPLLANVYPYFAYKEDTNGFIPLDFALFRQQATNNGYQNLFDAMLDSIYYALEKIGAPNLQVVVSESGWPSYGGKGASVDNAGTYYQNLINHVQRGTPKRNGLIETYLFAMFDENNKDGDEIERHFGLFNPNKSPKYGIKFN